MSPESLRQPLRCQLTELGSSEVQLNGLWVRIVWVFKQTFSSSVSSDGVIAIPVVPAALGLWGLPGEL